MNARLLIILGALLLAGAPPAYSLSFGDVLKATADQLQKTNQPGAQSSSSQQTPVTGTADQAGLWRDPHTGLTWMRCTLHDKFNGATKGCDYDDATQGPFSGKWFDAVLAVKAFSYGGYSDWRLPSLQEVANLYACKPGQEGLPPDYQDVPSPSGAVRIIKDCPGFEGGDPPALNTEVFVFSGDRDRLWTTTPADASGNRFWTYGQHGLQAVPDANSPNDGTAYALAVRGGSYAQFAALASRADAARTADITRQQREKREADARIALEEQQRIASDQRNAAKDKADRAAREKEYVAFRASVKPGDTVWVYLNGKLQKGLVVEVEDATVRVQASDPVTQVWLQRSKLFPAD